MVQAGSMPLSHRRTSGFAKNPGETILASGAASPDLVAKPEIYLMTNEEKTSLKAACLQAATTLIAARDSIKGAVDQKCGRRR
jgi:hypothetical protein